MPGGATLIGTVIVALWFATAVGVAWYAKRRGSPYWPWHGLAGIFFGLWYFIGYWLVTRNRDAAAEEFGEVSA